MLEQTPVPVEGVAGHQLLPAEWALEGLGAAGDAFADVGSKLGLRLGGRGPVSAARLAPVPEAVIPRQVWVYGARPAGHHVRSAPEKGFPIQYDDPFVPLRSASRRKMRSVTGVVPAHAPTVLMPVSHRHLLFHGREARAAAAVSATSSGGAWSLRLGLTDVSV